MSVLEKQTLPGTREAAMCVCSLQLKITTNSMKPLPDINSGTFSTFRYMCIYTSLKK